ncbi:creatininase family protein [Streptomyces sp. AM 2-1-1]|uniref:creatininase family protein n=1 Tax=Streptomyces sp. AM 2-1-1 TaxID=3028709 RepID=UPI0023B953C0|nr:creatininase family protein [Streptomyces sp. AM 2-1-1]WEH40969.1 creatininase family protein [Streptomyces sp. AM 2-1-1]
MPAGEQRRSFGKLTGPQVTADVGDRSVICLPVGSLEQHGPHLPLNTDTVIAERFAARLAAHVADRHDLWVVPPVPYGLSPEHTWSPGTITLTIPLYAGLIEALVGEYLRATPARAVLIINGHGGNKGVLEALVHQLRRTHDAPICVANPASLGVAHREDDAAFPEVHAGNRETALMLALAPDHVRLDRLPDEPTTDLGRREEIQSIVLGRGTTWPWSSDDPAISAHGVIGGDPRRATVEHGQALVAAALDAGTDILDRLTPRID